MKASSFYKGLKCFRVFKRKSINANENISDKVNLERYLQRDCEGGKGVDRYGYAEQIDEFEHKLKRQFKPKKSIASYPKIKLKEFSNLSLKH